MLYISGRGARFFKVPKLSVISVKLTRPLTGRLHAYLLSRWTWRYKVPAGSFTEDLAEWISYDGV